MLLSIFAPYLELDLGLSDIMSRSRAGSDLLCLSDLVANVLNAESIKWVTLNSVDGEDGSWVDDGESSRKEELLGGSGLLDDLDQTWLELLNGWDVVGEDTHLSGVGGDIDLDDILGGVDLLYGAGIISDCSVFISWLSALSAASFLRSPCLYPIHSPRPTIVPPPPHLTSSAFVVRIGISTYLVWEGQAQLDLSR